MARKRRAKTAKPSVMDRTSLTILLLGDEGVGKSSLISTFVSRHFSEAVPGIMTRVRLPPDPSTSNRRRTSACTVTIVDSQNGENILMASTSNPKAADVPANIVTTTPTSSSSFISTAQTTISSPSSASLGSGRGSASGIMSSTSAIVEGETSAFNLGGGAASSLLATNAAGLSSSSTVAAAKANFGVGRVDSIVLVYDVERPETFVRLETTWLPLLEQCYRGEIPVIIAGNKMDLYSAQPSSSSSSSASNLIRGSSSPAPTSDESLVRSRQRIISLLQRFKFVRQVVKCSARNLLNVDEIFVKAQQAVLYPMPPLYDLNVGQMTPRCRRAFLRIFRIHDEDRDGLLSNEELNTFQRRAFDVPLVERDLTGWKKVVSRDHDSGEEGDDALNNDVVAGGDGSTSEVIRDGKFTARGFLSIFDVFISRNRLEIPWTILRTFGYNDDLVLEVPSTVLQGRTPSRNRNDLFTIADEHHYKSAPDSSEDWKLSPSSVKFLTALFQQFDLDRDGILSPSDMRRIFDVVADEEEGVLAVPPWHPSRSPHIFEGCVSLPSSLLSYANGESVALSPPNTTFARKDDGEGEKDDNASVADVAVIGRPLSYHDWMGRWHLSSSISAQAVRAELYRLGHVEDWAMLSLFSADVRRTRRSTANERKLVTTTSNKSSQPKEYVDADHSFLLLPSKEIRVAVIGPEGCGISSMLSALQSLGNDVATAVDPPTKPISRCARVQIQNFRTGVKDQDEELVVHILLTELTPDDVRNGFYDKAMDDDNDDRDESGNTKGYFLLQRHFDLVVFAFDCNDEFSWVTVQQCEKTMLDDSFPRLFMAMNLESSEIDNAYRHDELVEGRGESQREPKFDQIDEEGGRIRNVVVNAAIEHCAAFELEAPVIASAYEPDSSVRASCGGKVLDRDGLLIHFVRCVIDLDDETNEYPSLRSIPLLEPRRRAAAKRIQKLWIGSLLCLGVIGITVMGARTWWCKANKEKGSDKLNWFLWLKHFDLGRLYFLGKTESANVDSKVVVSVN